MTHEQKLSLPAAILININIMVGAGLFINTVELAKRAGVLGSFIYLIVGALMLPLIISIATLINLFPEGGFYAFGEKTMSSFAGFIASWSYFTGKLASATIMIHTSVLLIQNIIPIFNIVSPLFLDGIIITLFVILNMLHMKTGRSIQVWFLVLKIIPITFAILSGLFLFQGSTFTLDYCIWSGIPSSLPLVLFAFLGFEATCSLSSKIKNAEHNGPRAILISYAIVIFLSFLFQFIFYANLGPALAQQPSYLHAFPLLLQSLFPISPALQTIFVGLLHLAIASSALGGSYGIIFSNNWNLYTLAKNNHTFLPKLFTTLNRHSIPVACIIAEGVICIFYLFVTKGNQIPLQQTGALGCTIGYTISVLALLVAKIKKPTISIPIWIPLLGTINCLLLIGACLESFLLSGINTLIAFCFLLIIGIFMFISTQRGQKSANF